MKYYLLLFILIMSYGCKSSKNKKEEIDSPKSAYAVNFSNASKLEDVIAQAKAERKMIYLDFGASWCAPCKQMKKNVYTDKQVGEVLNTYFIPYLIDGEKNQGPDLRVMYEVEGYPTLFVLDANGRILGTTKSSLSQSALLEFLQSFIKI